MNKNYTTIEYVVIETGFDNVYDVIRLNKFDEDQHMAIAFCTTLYDAIELQNALEHTEKTLIMAYGYLGEKIDRWKESQNDRH